MPDNELQNKLRKEWQYYCAHECPRRNDSEAGMPSCGPCGWEEDEEEADQV